MLYELLSGRIPYEGPDTKTTNSYVVKGDAQPPSVHDVSIPEPLARVTMHALELSAQNRLKDGADAEAALREAWERCLTQGLVAPAALAGDEIAHDKVGAMMHGRVTNPQGWAEAAARQDRGPAGEGPTRRDGGAGRARSPGLVIESAGDERGTGDDDPTRILIRDDLKPRVREDSEPAAPPPPAPLPSSSSSGRRQGSAHGAQSGQGGHGKSTSGRGDIAYDPTVAHRSGGDGSGTDRVERVARGAVRKSRGQGAATQASSKRSVPAWIIVLLVAAIVGALAGTYLVLAGS